MTSLEEKIKILKDNVKTYPDFPKPGVLFKDSFSVFNKAETLPLLHDVIIDTVKGISSTIDVVAALDARGFLIGPTIAFHFNIPFVPIRKKGKLPGEVYSESYALEYGEDTLVIQCDSIKKGQRVLIVDDFLATGGSLSAGCKLVEKAGGVVVSCFALMEATALKGRDKIPADVITSIKF